uniref:LIM zinc-binding domain-containing protein n=1 Tax=Spongospora subterranea TaxID=70186 RepID=A0A0H5R6S1_9EUKA|eukprot:CRZ09457.1 hypothetical protein [Spongospora subterranea]
MLSCLRDYVSLSHRQCRHSLLLTSLEIGVMALDRDNLPQMIQTMLMAFGGCLAPEPDPNEKTGQLPDLSVQPIQCLCQTQSRWRNDAAAPSSCIILAQKSFAIAGTMAFLLEKVATDPDEDRCSWLLRLAYVLDFIETNSDKCCGAIAPINAVKSTSSETLSSGKREPKWNDFVQAIHSRKLIKAELMAVFFEILVGRLATKEQDRRQGCQARFIRNPNIFNSITQLLSVSDAGAWKTAMNNLSYLLENESCNADAIMLNKNWLRLILGLLKLPQVAVLSCRNSKNFLEVIGNDDTSFCFKMIINVLSIILLRVLWTKRDGTRYMLKQTIDTIEDEFGYGDMESAALVRIVLYVLSNRLRHFSVHQLQDNPVALPNVIKLIEAIEQFIFYSVGYPKYSVEYHDIVLHTALDGNADADKDLLDAAVLLCEFVHRYTFYNKDIPNSLSEQKPMLNRVRDYLALFSDIACLFAVHNAPIPLLVSTSLVKKAYLKAGIGHKLPRVKNLDVAQLRSLLTEREAAKAQRLQVAQDIELRFPERTSSDSNIRTRDYTLPNFERSPSLTRDSIEPPPGTTIAPRSYSRRMRFMLKSYGSLSDAQSAAERHSGRVRPVYIVEKGCERTRKGDADHLLYAEKGDLVVLMSPHTNSKMMLGSCRNRTGFIPKSCLNLKPVGFEVDVQVQKTDSSSMHDRATKKLIAASPSIITTFKMSSEDSGSSEVPDVIVDESASNIATYKYGHADPYETSIASATSSIKGDSRGSLDSFGSNSLIVSSIPRPGFTSRKDHASEQLQERASHSKTGSFGGSSLALIAEMNSLKFGIEDAESQGGSVKVVTKRNSLYSLNKQGKHRYSEIESIGFIVGIAQSQLELVNAEAAAVFLEIGNDMSEIPAELRLNQADIDSVKSKLDRELEFCQICKTSILKYEDIYRLDDGILCKFHYIEKGPPCSVCWGPLTNHNDSCRISNGTRAHNSCAVCSECLTHSNGETMIEWKEEMYCKNDFLDLFRRSCSACSNPTEKDFCSIGGKSFHRQCIACFQCHAFLGDGESQIVMMRTGDQIYCEKHAREAMLSLCCSICQLEIHSDQNASTLNIAPYRFHWECASCSVCGKNAVMDSPESYHIINHNPVSIVCHQDYIQLSTIVECPSCKNTIEMGQNRTLVAGTPYHLDCLRCSICQTSLLHRTIYEHNGKLICHSDYDAMRATIKEGKVSLCEACGELIRSTRKGVKVKGRKMHQDCVKCSVCDEKLGTVGHIVFIHRKKLLCEKHHLEIGGGSES